MLRVHGRSWRAAEVNGELLHVGEWPAHPELVRRVDAGEDAQLERFVSVLGAPDVGSAHPEQLTLRVALETREKLLLATVAEHPVVWKQHSRASSSDTFKSPID